MVWRFGLEVCLRTVSLRWSSEWLVWRFGLEVCLRTVILRWSSEWIVWRFVLEVCLRTVSLRWSSEYKIQDTRIFINPTWDWCGDFVQMFVFIGFFF